MTLFLAMIQRFFIVPLIVGRFLNDKKYIICTGVKNGFQTSIMESLMRKKLKKQKGLKIDIVPSSRMQHLQSTIGSPNDSKLKHESRGIHKLTHADCEKSYIGPTSRLVSGPWGEHEGETETARYVTS